jgi:AcrR family transcriptional regulator
MSLGSYVAGVVCGCGLAASLLLKCRVTHKPNGSVAYAEQVNPPTGPDATRERILAAATAEFSRHGIAGARIERIAKAAKTSKERVYAHFRGKQELHRIVSARELAAVAEATRMDPADLPGYAGRVHDHLAAHPERYRLMAWGRLELADVEDGEPAAAQDPACASVAHKIGQLRDAQRDGLLDPAWDPLDILVILNQIALSWAQPDLTDVAEHERSAFLAARRAAILVAVQRLFPATAR